MELSGIKLRNFRSIGDQSVVLDPWRKCNILVGQNNSGKSNAIRALKLFADVINSRRRERTVIIADNDYHRRDRQNVPEVLLRFTGIEGEDDELITATANSRFEFVCQLEPDAKLRVVDHTFANIETFKQADNALQLIANRRWRAPVGPREIRQEFLPLGDSIFFGRFANCIPEVHIIPEFRRIQPAESYRNSGEGLIETLKKWQNPNIGNRTDWQRFDKIQRLLRDLLHLPDATLEVSHTNELTLTRDAHSPTELALPLLQNYGTGVHELLILITAILSVDNAICCIEEPEIHFHPRLQREFLEFITAETTNQYLISTHSATFLNAPSTMPRAVSENIQVFHLQVDNGATVGGPILEGLHSLQALDDLGTKASDILQTNCVIWVEGPSDRVYVKHWLGLVDPQLVEGLHYSVMFYGSRDHLSNLSFDDGLDSPEDDELIRILKINQRPIVIMDSDRESAGENLTEVQQTVQRQCEAVSGLAWITHGRAIENYLAPNTVNSMLVSLGWLANPVAASDPFDSFGAMLDEKLKSIGKRKYTKSKVSYARRLVEHCAKEDMTEELLSQVEMVVNKIKEWNT